MADIKIDFNEKTGTIKPMHCVNNGPYWTNGVEQVKENFTWFKEASIPYVRNHDASFESKFGGEHTVDVHSIFPDFDRDVDDEQAYDFTYTDLYTQKILETGSKVFYRLGTKIEHGIKKYGTKVPEDFEKWAKICEHIIRHYNEGWANGFHWNIEYWEIWNEADGVQSDGNQPNWTGTPEQYYEMYTVTSKHLKKCFPNLKIGGPALSDVDISAKWFDGFLEWIKKESAPMDFFSWHIYSINPYKIAENAEVVRKKLDEAGYTNAENILNEWNYVENWTDLWVTSLESMKNERGAAYTISTMCKMQKTSLDMLMYYDARPSCGMNGLFDTLSLRPLKGYFGIRMYSELYKLGNEVFNKSEEKDFYTVAAEKDGKKAAIITHYSIDRNITGKWVNVNMEGVSDDEKFRYYLVDKNFTMYEHKAEMKGGKFKIYMEADSFILVTNYCIND